MKADDLTRAVLARDDVARFLRTMPGGTEAETRQQIESYLDELRTTQRYRFYRALHARLQNGRWTGEAIHNAIHEAGKESGLAGAKAFGAIYAAFLGAKRGPRAGHFLASLDRAFVLRRLQ